MPAKGTDVEVASPKDVLDALGQLGFPAGCRPLRAAASRANPDGTRELLGAGANPDAQDARGSAPLMAACVAREAGQRLAVVRQLLSSGAHPTATNAESLSPLHFSTAVDTDVMDALIAQRPAAVPGASNGTGITLLSLAVPRGQESAVACLLRHGAGDKIQGLQRHDEAKSDLVMAVDAGHENIVRLLVDAGPSALDLREAVHAGVWHRSPRVVHALLAATEGWSRRLVANHPVEGRLMLHLAAASGSLATVHALLWAGAFETFVDAGGDRAANVIGSNRPPCEGRDPYTEAAISRVLERGPAFCARSLAWEESVACGGSNNRRIGTGGSLSTFGVLPTRVFRSRGRASLFRMFCR